MQERPVFYDRQNRIDAFPAEPWPLRGQDLPLWHREPPSMMLAMSADLLA